MRQFVQTFSTFTLVLCAAFALQTDSAWAEIYKWTDSNGKTHYSDAAPAEQAAESITLDNINTFEDVSISDAPEWQGFYKPEIKPRVKNVVMFSTERCGYCKKARRYFNDRCTCYSCRTQTYGRL